jgi:deazaflavin-dependent oxidoreductase (nitroreductase family)
MPDTEVQTETNASDANAWEEALIDDLRSNRGRPSQGPLKGQAIMVAYSTGAKSGERRRSILTYSRDGDAYVIAGTASGSPTTPSWVVNLEANPDLEFEIGDQTHTGRAEVLREGAERDRLWKAHVELLPHFGAYPEQTGRVIPIARIVERGS